MIARLFHGWERRLASVDNNRVVRPFAWGLDHLGLDPQTTHPRDAFVAYARGATANSDAFFAYQPTTDYQFDGHRLTYPSAIASDFPDNNTVLGRVFPAQHPPPGRPKRAVIVMAQWNADAGGHVGLCQGLARFGITALRLSLPYHDARRPPELDRADYIVSANIGLTLQANRQAVLDARRAVDWLVAQGYERIGMLGTSLGSNLSMLTMVHDARIVAGAFNHVSPYFADVVWRGISTRHVRAGIEGHISLDDLRECWMPISPWPVIDRVRDRPVLLVYARYDLTFPVDLSKKFIAEFQRQQVAHEVAVLPCGHYTTGKAPFKFLDGYYLVRFFLRRL